MKTAKPRIAARLERADESPHLMSDQGWCSLFSLQLPRAQEAWPAKKALGTRRLIQKAWWVDTLTDLIHRFCQDARCPTYQRPGCQPNIEDQRRDARWPLGSSAGVQPARTETDPNDHKFRETWEAALNGRSPRTGGAPGIGPSVSREGDGSDGTSSPGKRPTTGTSPINEPGGRAARRECCRVNFLAAVRGGVLGVV